MHVLSLCLREVVGGGPATLTVAAAAFSSWRENLQQKHNNCMIYIMHVLQLQLYEVYNAKIHCLSVIRTRFYLKSMQMVSNVNICLLLFHHGYPIRPNNINWSDLSCLERFTQSTNTSMSAFMFITRSNNLVLNIWLFCEC